MKSHKIYTTIIITVLILSLSVTALAVGGEDFSDISGHWAEQTVLRGHDDGLIQGYEDGTVRPNDPITTAQMITILTRVLGATEKSTDIASLGISEDVWYSDSAAKALYLGLIDDSTGHLDAEMSRQNAMWMMAKAFSLTPASPDLSVLSTYSDGGLVSAKNRPSMAALISAGLVQGFDGALNANGSITRAEFLTILYRVAENYISPSELSSATVGGSLIRGSGSLNYVNLSDNIWFDCAASSVSLSGVTADTLTLRSHKLDSLSVYGGTRLNRLVVDCPAGSISLPEYGGAAIGTLQLAGSVGGSISGAASNIEITGSGISAKISGSHDSLTVTGTGSSIVLEGSAKIGKLILSGSGNTITTAAGAAVENVAVSGSKNEIDGIMGVSGCKAAAVLGKTNKAYLSISQAMDSAEINADESKLEIHGDYSVGNAAVSGSGNWMTLSCLDMDSISVSGSYNTVHKARSGKVNTINVSQIRGAFTLYVENEVKAFDLSGADNTVCVNGSVEEMTVSGKNAVIDGEGSVAKLVIKASGSKVSVPVTETDDSTLRDEERVLSLVTLGYKGDYTLKWAQEHDYEDYEKEIWVNAKGYSSETNYLVWINLSMQRVNIFEGSKGNWSLIKSFIVGTGAPGHGTPVGTWYLSSYRIASGWTTSTYTCRPVTGFRVGNSNAYAFHSRLYYPGTNKLSDASIGYPVSHGCIRMYDDDAWYMYNKMPVNTTVVVY